MFAKELLFGLIFVLAACLHGDDGEYGRIITHVYEKYFFLLYFFLSQKNLRSPVRRNYFAILGCSWVYWFVFAGVRIRNVANKEF